VKKPGEVVASIVGASFGQRGRASALREDPVAPPGSPLMTEERLIGQLPERLW
jgi:hypothetical protein